MHTRRIARGARWMDRHHPGWYNQIDQDALSPESDDYCILGQIEKPGNFQTFMRRRYFLPHYVAEAIENGERIRDFLKIITFPGIWFGVVFMVSKGFTGVRESPSQWVAAWKKEIRQRQDRDDAPLFVSEILSAADQARSKVPML